MAKRRRPTVSVDFDGVIHSYTSPWDKAHIIPDAPVGGAIEFLSKTLQKFDVVIISSRARTWRGRRAIRRWLRRHAGVGLWFEAMSFRGLEDVVVTAKKLPALVYIDDRAYRFTGSNWPTELEIEKLRPWNRTLRRPKRGQHGKV